MDMSEPLSHICGSSSLIECQGDEALRLCRPPRALLIGEDPFGELALRLAARLKVRCVVIGFLEGPTMIQEYALALDGERREPQQYALPGTPCETVVDRSVCYYHDDVQECFPSDEMLVEMGFHSYFGMPIQGPTGIAMGVIAALDSEPIQLQWDSLQLLANIAAAALAVHSGLQG